MIKYLSRQQKISQFQKVYTLCFKDNIKLQPPPMNNFLRENNFPGFFSISFPSTSQIIYHNDEKSEKFLLEKNPDNIFQEWSNLFKPNLTVPCGNITGSQYDISFQSVERSDELLFLFMLFLFILENHDCQILDLTAQKHISAKEIKQTVERGTFQLKQLINWHHVSDGTARGWFHTHGMEKFGLSNLETYFLQTNEIQRYQKLFLDLIKYRIENGSYSPLPAAFSSCLILPRLQILRQLPDSIRRMFKNHGKNYLAVVQKDFFD